VQIILAQGHYVGLESDTWQQLSETASASAIPAEETLPDEVAAHLRQLAAFGLGAKDVRFFLPTSAQLNPATAGRASAWGLTMVAGTPGTLSYATATVEGTPEFVSSQVILDDILKAAKMPGGLNGCLLLFPLDAGARQTDKFCSRFGELIEALRDRGYEFVRVDQLLTGDNPRGAPQPTLVNVNHP